MCRNIMLALLSVAIAGCSRTDKPVPKASATYLYRVSIDSDFAHTRLKLKADGQEIGDYLPAAFPEQFKVTRELIPPMNLVKVRQLASRDREGRPKPGLPVITALALMPCGWAEVPVKVRPPHYPQGGLPGDVIELQADIEGLRDTIYVKGRRGMTSIVVDNRGGSAHELGIGQWKHAIKADAAEILRAGRIDCAEIKSLKLDGVEIAALPSDPSKTMLLDTSGARCYYFRGLNYFRAGEAGWSPWQYPLRKQKLHVIAEAQGNIDYLFEKAPSKVRSAIGFEQRSELTERSCQDYSDD